MPADDTTDDRADEVVSGQNVRDEDQATGLTDALDAVGEAALDAFDEQTAKLVSGIAPAGPDAAVAVPVDDFRLLVEHARKTGAEELAAKFPAY